MLHFELYKTNLMLSHHAKAGWAAVHLVGLFIVGEGHTCIYFLHFLPVI